MKISTKGRYGLRALVDLAAHAEHPGDPVALSGVAERQKLSLNYMEQVFGILRKAGLVISVKGPAGGYCIGRSMDSITLREILDALEGPFSIADQGDGEEDQIRESISKNVWDKINSEVVSFLEQTTLQQLVEKYNQNCC